MSNWKKTCAVLLTAILILAMSVSALADGEPTLDNHAVTTTNEVVRIVKEITVYNPENATVNEPTATYTYTIAAGSADKIIKDGQDPQVQAPTIAGVTTGIKVASQTSPTAASGTSVTLTYSPTADATLNASAAGTANEKWVEFDFSGVNFGAPGVYRYEITEEAAAYSSNGVVEGTTGHNRYLDVYVKAAADQTVTDEADKWEVYGYALSTSDDGIDANTDPKQTNKTTGFVSHTDGTEDKTADQYYTFNLVVEKTVTNDPYIKSTLHKFPFTITLTNTTVTANVLPIMTLSDNASQTALSAAAIAGTWTPSIADGASVTYVGIPAGTTISIKETNDVVGTTYLVTITGADTNPDAANVYYNNDSSEAKVTSGATAGAAATANKTVSFDNNLQLISPTGVILRVAPYVLMLAVGVVLLVIARRKRATR